MPGISFPLAVHGLKVSPCVTARAPAGAADAVIVNPPAMRAAASPTAPAATIRFIIIAIASRERINPSPLKTLRPGRRLRDKPASVSRPAGLRGRCAAGRGGLPHPPGPEPVTAQLA